MGVTPGYSAARRRLLEACGGHCQGCRRHVYVETLNAHHRLPRSAGRDDTPANLMALCLHCHAWCHANPKRATELGWIVRRGQLPAEVPVIIDIDRLAWRPRCD